MTAGTTPRRTLRKVKTNDHSKRAVIGIVPIKASNAAFLSVMVGGGGADGGHWNDIAGTLFKGEVYSPFLLPLARQQRKARALSVFRFSPMPFFHPML